MYMHLLHPPANHSKANHTQSHPHAPTSYIHQPQPSQPHQNHTQTHTLTCTNPSKENQTKAYAPGADLSARGLELPPPRLPVLQEADEGRHARARPDEDEGPLGAPWEGGREGGREWVRE